MTEISTQKATGVLKAAGFHATKIVRRVRLPGYSVFKSGSGVGVNCDQADDPIAAAGEMFEAMRTAGLSPSWPYGENYGAFHVDP